MRLLFKMSVRLKEITKIIGEKANPNLNLFQMTYFLTAIFKRNLG